MASWIDLYFWILGVQYILELCHLKSVKYLNLAYIFQLTKVTVCKLFCLNLVEPLCILLVLKAELISILVIAEHVLPPVNFPYIYITVLWKINI